MPQAPLENPSSPLMTYLLHRADDALILGHRLSEWCGHAPTLEEDVALANIALDILGQARLIFAYAAELHGAGLDEDDYAYLRNEWEYGNALLTEQPNGDFGYTIVRLYLYSAFMRLYWSALCHSTDEQLKAIAKKAIKECAYHVTHSRDWVVRLGDGTSESKRRAQAAVDQLWPLTGEMFEMVAGDEALIADKIIPDVGKLQSEWSSQVSSTLHEASLSLPSTTEMQKGGRSGNHSEHLGHLLSELQYLQRKYPGATW